jgi:hypothetical protein
VATYGTFVDNVTLKASEANDFFVWNIGPSTNPVKQSNTPAQSNYQRGYAQVNKMVCWYIWWQSAGNGTSNNAITIDLPVAAAANSVRVIGAGYVFDNSVSDLIRVVVVRRSTTQVSLLAEGSTSLSTYLGQTDGPTLTLQSGDNIAFTCFYEAE